MHSNIFFSLSYTKISNKTLEFKCRLAKCTEHYFFPLKTIGDHKSSSSSKRRPPPFLLVSVRPAPLGPQSVSLVRFKLCPILLYFLENTHPWILIKTSLHIQLKTITEKYISVKLRYFSCHLCWLMLTEHNVTDMKDLETRREYLTVQLKANNSAISDNT